MVEKPEDVTEALLVGIKPARLRLVHHAADPLGAQFFFEAGHADGIDAALHDDVGTVGGDSLGDFLERQFQMARDNSGELGTVCLGLGDQLAIDRHGVNRHVHGQCFAVTIGDDSALGELVYRFRRRRTGE